MTEYGRQVTKAFFLFLSSLFFFFAVYLKETGFAERTLVKPRLQRLIATISIGIYNIV